MVETLAAEGAHDPLADRVRIGGLDRCPNTLDADGSRPAGEVGAVDAVAVVDPGSWAAGPRRWLRSAGAKPRLRSDARLPRSGAAGDGRG